MDRLKQFKIYDKGKEIILNYDDVIACTKWFDSNGNPSYGLYMEDGSFYLSVDNYGISPNLMKNANILRVSRKKDL